MVSGLNGQFLGNSLYTGYNYGVNRGYATQPQQQISFQGRPQQAEENQENKKSNSLKKGFILGLVGAAVTTIALYAGVKTGILKKVDDPKTFTDKLKNLAFKGGDSIDKGVTALTTWAKDKIDNIKDKIADEDLVDDIPCGINETPKAKPKMNINFTDAVLGEEEIKEIMQGIKNGATSGTCQNGGHWTLG